MYLKSDKVHVFPFGSTRKVEPIARILNEQNISRIVRNLTDVNGFVISYDEKSKLIEFMIYGYYFKADLSSLVTDYKGKDIHAYIAVSEDSEYEYLLGGDTDGVETDPSSSDFTGLYINQKPNIPGATVHTLHILDKSGKVPENSLSKFSSNSVDLQIDYINCGTSTEVIH